MIIQNIQEKINSDMPIYECKGTINGKLYSFTGYTIRQCFIKLTEIMSNFTIKYNYNTKKYV